MKRMIIIICRIPSAYASIVLLRLPKGSEPTRMRLEPGTCCKKVRRDPLVEESYIYEKLPVFSSDFGRDTYENWNDTEKISIAPAQG